ncbi:helix-turn-helix transcriptional regulator, partial [Waltera sp.]
LAERLSVSTSAVSKWENGKNLPDMMMLSRIADILQVSCDELHNPEKTLEKLDNPEFQKRNVEEGDKENTDNTGENEESEPEPQKKNYGRIVRMSFLIGILAIAAGMFLIYMAGHRKPAFQQIGTRYIDDPLWGRVYEIAYVVDGEMTNDSINVHLDEVRATLNQEVIDTNIVKTTYYDNKEDATAWKETDVGGYVFLSGE